MLGIQGKQYISPETNNPYIQVVSIRQHITKKPSEIVYLNLRKTSAIQVMAILPNSRPSTGWRRGDLTNNCIKEIFDVGETQVFQNCNDKIVTTTPRSSTPRDTATTLNVRRHQEQCSRHKTIGTIPSYLRDPNFFREIWGEKSQNSTSGGLTRVTKGLRSKKNPTLGYI